ncbi:MAG: hypothetical protein M3R49_03655 [Chloroflexota bacterium]|nr:hypothetical protein [Chloroflexota bacterium]
MLLEPALAQVAELIDLLDSRDWPWTYAAVHDYASLLVGWDRRAPRLRPLTDVERWLRTSEAFDLALDHLIDRLEAAA